MNFADSNIVDNDQSRKKQKINNNQPMKHSRLIVN